MGRNMVSSRPTPPKVSTIDKFPCVRADVLSRKAPTAGIGDRVINGSLSPSYLGVRMGHSAVNRLETSKGLKQPC